MVEWVGGFSRVADFSVPVTRLEAEEKARTLFLSLLTEKQLEEFETRGWVTVRGGTSQRNYSIRAGYTGNILVQDETSPPPTCKCSDCQSRKGLRYVCCHMEIAVPYWDHMVAQILHLRYNEEAFLKTAYIS